MDLEKGCFSDSKFSDSAFSNLTVSNTTTISDSTAGWLGVFGLLGGLF